MPPLWAIAAIAVLGLNEFMVVLYNPLWLLFLVMLFLFAKTVYQELDVDGELQGGLLPGVLAISSKLVPVIKQAELSIFSHLPGLCSSRRPAFWPICVSVKISYHPEATLPFLLAIEDGHC